MIIKSTQTVFRICMEAAKSETKALMVFAFGTALVTALVSWVSAKVINRASEIIANGDHTLAGQPAHGLVEIIQHLSSSGLLLLAIAYGAFASVNAFINLFRYLSTSNWGTIMRQYVDGLVRKHRSSLDIGRLHSDVYEDIKGKIQEQPFGWSAIEQYATILAGLSGHFANLFIFGIALLFFNPWYALALFVGVLARATSEFYWNGRFWKFGEDEARYTRRRGIFSMGFSNIFILHELIYFGKAEIVDSAIRQNQRDQIGRKQKLVRGDFISSVLTELFSVIIFMGVIVHAIYMALVQRNVGLLVLTLDFSVRFVSNLKEVLFDLSSGWKAARSVKVITDEFFGLQPHIPQTGKQVPPGLKVMKFQNVSFAYPNANKLALTDINLEIPMGSKVAFVGPSGGGKSTFVSLIARHYDPTSGRILLDNQLLSDTHPDEWIRQCLCMGQDYGTQHVTFLEAVCFGGWTYDQKRKLRPDDLGINFGVEDLDMDRVREACRRAGILKFIESTPKGFLTMIGTEYGGVNLSKGEKQRIALAARLFAERKIMILDEPDAALDAKTKEHVIAGILNSDSTVILVIHNLRACESCDMVVFVRDGKIIEKGTHQELLDLGGEYAEMYNLQVVTSNNPSIDDRQPAPKMAFA